MFGVLKVFGVLSKKDTQYGKRVGLCTHCFVLSIDVYKYAMGLTCVLYL